MTESYDDIRERESKEVVNITMTKQQARAMARACELLLRLNLGQCGYIRDELLKRAIDLESDYATQDAALAYLKSIFFPELHGPGHSFGVGNENVPVHAHICYELYKVVMHHLRPEDDNWSVHSDSPYTLNYSATPRMNIKDE